MGGAQPLAATMNGAVALVAEVDPERIEKRLKTRYLDEKETRHRSRHRSRPRGKGRAAGCFDRRRGQRRGSARAAPRPQRPARARHRPDVGPRRALRLRSAGRHARGADAPARGGSEAVHRALLRDHGRPCARSPRAAAPRMRSSSTMATISGGRRRKPASPTRSRSAGSCLCTSGRSSARARGRSGGPRCRATRRTFGRPTARFSSSFPGTARSSAGSASPRSASRSRAFRPASAGWVTASAHRAGLLFNELVRDGRVRGPIVIGRDHLDSGSVASPNRETEGMRDGSDAIADWPILNALINTASGATWVSVHHGGGVGIGYSHSRRDGRRRGRHRGRGAAARPRAQERPGHGRHAPRRRRVSRGRRGRADAGSRPAVSELTQARRLEAAGARRGSAFSPRRRSPGSTAGSRFRRAHRRRATAPPELRRALEDVSRDLAARTRAFAENPEVSRSLSGGGIAVERERLFSSARQAVGDAPAGTWIALADPRGNAARLVGRCPGAPSADPAVRHARSPVVGHPDGAPALGSRGTASVRRSRVRRPDAPRGGARVSRAFGLGPPPRSGSRSLPRRSAGAPGGPAGRSPLVAGRVARCRPFQRRFYGHARRLSFSSWRSLSRSSRSAASPPRSEPACCSPFSARRRRRPAGHRVLAEPRVWLLAAGLFFFPSACWPSAASSRTATSGRSLPPVPRFGSPVRFAALVAAHGATLPDLGSPFPIYRAAVFRARGPGGPARLGAGDRRLARAVRDRGARMGNGRRSSSLSSGSSGRFSSSRPSPRVPAGGRGGVPPRVRSLAENNRIGAGGRSARAVSARRGNDPPPPARGGADPRKRAGRRGLSRRPGDPAAGARPDFADAVVTVRRAVDRMEKLDLAKELPAPVEDVDLSDLAYRLWRDGEARATSAL